MKSGVETPGWPSPGQRYGHTLTAVGEFLFVTGGYTMNGWTSEVWVYSIRERRWAMLNVKGDGKQTVRLSSVVLGSNDHFELSCQRISHDLFLLCSGLSDSLTLQTDVFLSFLFLLQCH